MADLIAWLDLHAGAVQGLTAIGVFILTIVLAAATVWYAKSAKDQVDELVRARLATVKPHMHVVASSHGGSVGNYLDGLVVKANLKDIGVGPAIDLVARLEHARLKFAPVTQSATIAVGDTHNLAFVAHESSTDLGQSKELVLIAEYRDLANIWWETRAPANLGYTRNGDGTYTNPSVSFRVHEEVVRRLPNNRPTMQGWVSARDMTIPDRAYKTDLAGLP